jgi:hypothetical protein
MAELEDRFKNFIVKIGQVSAMVKKLAGENVPDFISMSLKANLTIGTKKYTLIISPEENNFIEGHDSFTEFLIKADDEQFWNDVFDGKYTFFGGYTQALVEIPNFRPHRYKVFYISGMLAMLQNLGMGF